MRQSFRRAGMAEPAIDITGLEFAWPGGPLLLQIDALRIERAERVFLSGASGSGKSTLLGLISAVLQPRCGSVRIIGNPINQMSSGERDRFRGEHLGFIFQMFNLIPYLTVRENVLLPLRFSPTRRARLGSDTAEHEAERLLTALGLTGDDLLDRAVTALSIGQQQRVAAARALIGRPEVLIADEPTSSLDAAARENFLQLLINECESFGTTLLFVSHDRSLRSLFPRTLELAELNAIAAPEESWRAAALP